MASPALGPTAVAPAAAPVDGADAAIARVLAAERDARAAVIECGQQAERELQQARERARLIAARGAERTARVHAAIERRLDDRLAAIDLQRRGLVVPAGDTQADLLKLAAAVARLAEELTSATAGAEREPSDSPR